MTILVDLRPLVLVAPNSLVSQEIAIHQQTEAVAVTVRRSTTAVPRAWDAGSTIRMTLIFTVDGVERQRRFGQATGGIKSFEGVEFPVARLTFEPQWGRFGVPAGACKRLGEFATSSYTLRVEIDCLTGSINSEIDVTSTELPARDVPWRD